jgi:hypothetical protein
METEMTTAEALRLACRVEGYELKSLPGRLMVAAERLFELAVGDGIPADRAAAHVAALYKGQEN